MKITLERLKEKAGFSWMNNSKRLQRPVRIIGAGWYWRKDRAGYTDCKCSAGIYEFGDAWNASSHCGPEKRIVYEFLSDIKAKTTQESRGSLKFLLAGMNNND